MTISIIIPTYNEEKYLLFLLESIKKQNVEIKEIIVADGFSKDKTHVFIATLAEEHEQHLDDTEEIELLYRKPHEIEEMIRRNDIWDGMTLAAWSLARHHIFNRI